MTLTMMLLLAAAIVLPLVWISRRHSAGKTVKKPLIAHCLSFFVLVAAATVVGFVCSGSALAVDTAAATASGGMADGLKYVGAALAVGLSGIGGGIAVSSAAAVFPA